jgi:hypothetical protein
VCARLYSQPKISVQRARQAKHEVEGRERTSSLQAGDGRLVRADAPRQLALCHAALAAQADQITDQTIDRFQPLVLPPRRGAVA